MIGIIDYGMGNLHSVQNALRRLGVDYFLSEKKEELAAADALLLPGVGAFKDAMHALKENGMDTFIRESVQAGKPLLGICLGMQLLFEESEENGLTDGLNLLPGRVVRFPGIEYKVPHMGWNQLIVKQPGSPLLQNLSSDYVYFVHSYFVKTDDQNVLIATSDYHEEVPAIVGKDHIFGAQFHPEKSSTAGVEILKNFANYVERRKADATV
ncbi:imidazole glycerol phosphate synthase subunit HisH [Pseudalkalibacillus berkeleyi]|uniref:Imidazole glycerol phosphate synthase subunit HisH n=1 Tax=Pseudalkalibacillus berkeleyi TaxID=1069813 RepID=A0ABS9H3L0_9BACL|nr:imidazole glycerol phosphate synthase subunit HisH [Pseudalkalibacillus berkeleyi]MCF6138691.1 imidazole glycerol phosphate synthase subunit HisH [Pseudalkalibacillus berkeleyi]